MEPEYYASTVGSTAGLALRAERGAPGLWFRAATGTATNVAARIASEVASSSSLSSRVASRVVSCMNSIASTRRAKTLWRSSEESGGQYIMKITGQMITNRVNLESERLASSGREKRQ